MNLAIVNSRVWTGDARRPWADAIAIEGEHIAAVGSSAEMMKRAANARVIDARGAMVVPGFIDTHVHFIEGGFRLASAQLRDARTPAEFTARLEAFAATVRPGTWILGGDWDHRNWGGELPRRAWIDPITPEHPVLVNRFDGHMALANSLALRVAGVTAATADAEGGEIFRGVGGEPTGVLKDSAMEMVWRVVPEATADQRAIALDAAMRSVAPNGVTGVHHMGTWADLATFERAHAAGALRTRVYAAVPLASWERLAAYVRERGGFGDAWLRWGGLKGVVDGSLGSHAAAMLEPFTGAPDNRGLFVTGDADRYAWASGADAAGLQVIVHAIGDRAIRGQLDLFARVAHERGPRDRRWRIEHARHVAPEDFARFAALGVIPSMQPSHGIADGRLADEVIGPGRAKGTYAFRSMLDAGAQLAFGSDWFVAPPAPLEGIYAAVTRRTLDGGPLHGGPLHGGPLHGGPLHGGPLHGGHLDGGHLDGWVPEQRITVEEALRAYTAGAAYAGFADHDRGVLRAGMLADLVMVDRDLTRVPPEEIREARVLFTMVGGTVVFER